MLHESLRNKVVQLDVKGSAKEREKERKKGEWRVVSYEYQTALLPRESRPCSCCNDLADRERREVCECMSVDAFICLFV